MPTVCTMLVVLAASLAVLLPPLAAPAQQSGKTARVGWLGDRPWPVATRTALETFRQGMRERGWTEGQNLGLEVRWSDGDRALARVQAGELVRTGADVIVAQGPMAVVARGEMPSTPIVFGFSGDPIEAKLVASMRHPGGNLTGITALSLELVGKRMALLKEALPRLTRVAVLANPGHPGVEAERRESEAAARRLGMTVQFLTCRSPAEIEAAFEAMARERAEAIVVFPDAFVNRNAPLIAEFAARRRIPAISGWAEFVEAGNLMSYGPNLRDFWHQAAMYVDRILRGARPADLPVLQPTKFEMAVNLKVARALGITIPPAVLARADQVID